MAQLWTGPVVLWATPENPEGRMISSCSLVGVHVFASTLRQIGRDFEIVYGDIAEDRTRLELDHAIKIAYAVRYLRKSKVGLIGYNAPGYANMNADIPSLNRGLGVQLHHMGLQELLDAMQALPEADVEADIRRVVEIGLPMVEVDKGDLEAQSRFYLAFRQLIATESLDALAVRCWPELPNIVGQWPYLAMTRLSDEGYPNGMEGDVDGAISCMLGGVMGFGRGYLSDWLEHTEDTITLWHGGNAPFDLCEPAGSEHGPRLARHFNIRKPMVVEAWLKADVNITAFRLWRCDGQYCMTARDGRTILPRRDLYGTNGLAEFEGGDIHKWFLDLCHAGMPHHIAVFPGHQTRLLRRLADCLKIRWFE
jgi:L-fucose isomerase-like protein